MKKIYSVFRGLFAIIGIFVVIAFCLYLFVKPYYEVSINIDKNCLGYCDEYVDSLRTSGDFAQDTAVFAFTIYQDTVQAQKIKDYFQLDTLFSSSMDDWDKTIAIGKFVAENIPHDNQKEDPERHAIGLWEYTKNVAPGFNCRLHSILTFELLLAAGIPARYVTCMPQDEEDDDCHVVNEVWLSDKHKWVMIDTDMGGNFITDLNNNPLSLQEIREHYIENKEMIMHPSFTKGSKKKDGYYAYMAKNTYWFSCWGDLSYSQEDWKNKNVVRDSYIYLIPNKFTPFRVSEDDIITTNADLFWSEPKICYN